MKVVIRIKNGDKLKNKELKIEPLKFELGTEDNNINLLKYIYPKTILIDC